MVASTTQANGPGAGASHGATSSLPGVRPGRILDGKYALLRPVGRGGMGAVWAARHLRLDAEVAVKIIRPEHAGGRRARARFMREARAAAALRSPNVVSVFDYGVDDGLPYIVMELLEGESLAARLRRDGPLTREATLAIMKGVCRAVQRAHDAGVVHRDLKPDNIFLVADGDREEVKVLDFGIAKVRHLEGEQLDGAATQTGALLGTPYYVSPEQAMDAREVDARADLWALGVITYECLLGERPFRGASLTALVLAICTEPLPSPSRRGSVPVAFDAWFTRAVCRDPDGRFDDAASLYRGLSEALAGRRSSLSMVARADPASDAGRSTANRRRRVGVVAFATVALAIAAVSLVGWRARRTDTTSDAGLVAAGEPEPVVGFDATGGVERRVHAAPATVRLRISGAPDGAVVYRGSRRLGSASAPVELDYGDTSVSVRIEAAGHATARAEVVPDHDQTVVVSMSVLPTPKGERAIERRRPATKSKKRDDRGFDG